jgi:hypothetical protein
VDGRAACHGGGAQLFGESSLTDPRLARQQHDRAPALFGINQVT